MAENIAIQEPEGEKNDVNDVNADIKYWKSEAQTAISRRDAGLKRAQDAEAKITELEEKLAKHDTMVDAASQKKLVEEGKYKEALEAKVTAAVKGEIARREKLEESFETLKKHHRTLTIRDKVLAAAVEAKAALPEDITRQLEGLFTLDDSLDVVPDETAWGQMGVDVRDEKGKMMDLSGLTSAFINAAPERLAAQSAGGGGGTQQVGATTSIPGAVLPDAEIGSSAWKQKIAALEAQAAAQRPGG